MVETKEKIPKAERGRGWIRSSRDIVSWQAALEAERAAPSEAWAEVISSLEPDALSMPSVKCKGKRMIPADHQRVCPPEWELRHDKSHDGGGPTQGEGKGHPRIVENYSPKAPAMAPSSKGWAVRAGADQEAQERCQQDVTIRYLMTVISTCVSLEVTVCQTQF